MSITSHLNLPHSFADAVRAWLATKPLTTNSQRAYMLELQRLMEWGVSVGHKSLTSLLEGFDLWGFVEFVTLQHAVKHEGKAPTLGSLQQTKRIATAFIRDSAKALRLPASDAWSVDHDQLRDFVGEPDARYERLCIEGAMACRDLLLATPTEPGALAANLAFWCCGTAQEIAGLRGKDIQSGDVISIVLGQGIRKVAAPPHLGLALRAMLNCGLCREDPVVATTRGTPQTPPGVRRLLKRAGENCGVRAANARMLRRAFILLVQGQPVSTRVVAHHAGNRQMRTRAQAAALPSTAWKGVTVALERG